MKLISVNVGLPRPVFSNGEVVTTGFFKAPAGGRVAARKRNLDGDRQADLAVHGGPSKAVYAYPVEHYAYWKGQLPGLPLPFGSFGENLTTEGLLEGGVSIGDRLRIGTAELVVTQPRLPCYKMGIRFGRQDMEKRFLSSGRTGFYLAVAQEGELGAGDAIERVGREPTSVTVADLVRLRTAPEYTAADVEVLRRAVRIEALSDGWRKSFLAKLAEVSAAPTYGLRMPPR